MRRRVIALALPAFLLVPAGGTARAASPHVDVHQVSTAPATYVARVHPQLTVSGLADPADTVSVTLSGISEPSERTMTAPAETVHVKPDGTWAVALSRFPDDDGPQRYAVEVSADGPDGRSSAPTLSLRVKSVLALSIATDDARPVVGAPVVLTGTIANEKGEGLAAAHATLFGVDAKGRGFPLGGVVATDTHGRWQRSVTIPFTMRVRAFYPENDFSAAVSSGYTPWIVPAEARRTDEPAGSFSAAKMAALIPQKQYLLGRLPAGDEDWYGFSVPRSAAVRLDLVSMTHDGDLALYDRAGRLLHTSRRPGERSEELLVPLRAGTYYARVFHGSSTGTTAYRFRAEVLPSGTQVLDRLVTLDRVRRTARVRLVVVNATPNPVVSTEALVHWVNAKGHEVARSAAVTWGERVPAYGRALIEGMLTDAPPSVVTGVLKGDPYRDPRQGLPPHTPKFPTVLPGLLETGLQHAILRIEVVNSSRADVNGELRPWAFAYDRDGRLVDTAAAGHAIATLKARERQTASITFARNVAGLRLDCVLMLR